MSEKTYQNTISNKFYLNQQKEKVANSPSNKSIQEFQQALSQSSEVSSQEKSKKDVVFIATTGGFDGGGKDKTSEVQNYSGTEKIYNKVHDIVNKENKNFKGQFIDPGVTCSSTIETAKKHITKNYDVGDKLIIYGYSNGARCSIDLAHSLQKDGMKVDELITVDATDRHFRNYTLNTSIPSNVKSHHNYYQRGSCGIIKCSRGEEHTANDLTTTISNTKITSDQIDNLEYRKYPHRYMEAIVESNVLNNITSSLK